jgi:uncharacterized protein (TIGR02145 family)
MKSTSRVIPVILVFFAFLLSYCSKDSDNGNTTNGDNTVPADSLLVSDTLVVIDNDTIAILPGNSITGKLTGKWTVEAITNENGLSITDPNEIQTALGEGKIVKLDNVTGPATKLRGQLFHSYQLRWTVTNGVDSRSAKVIVKFKLDSLFNSGNYYQTFVVADSSLTLYAKSLNKSLKAKWSIIEKSTNYAAFSVDTTYKTTFFGRLTGKYVIEYKVYTRDKAFTRAQQMTVRFDYMTDVRDGEKYKVVRIGNKIWMAENLRFLRGQYYSTEYQTYYQHSLNSTNTGIGGLTRYSTGSTPADYYLMYYGAMVYNGDSIYRDSYGCYYPYSTVVYKSENIITRKLAPPGWHIADTTDWRNLDSIVNSNTVTHNGSKLKSTSSWLGNAGTDNYGFNAKAGGYIVYTIDTFNTKVRVKYGNISSRGLGEKAMFWSVYPGTYQYNTYPIDSSVRAVQLTKSNQTFNTRLKISEKQHPGTGSEGLYNLPVRCVRDNWTD